MGHVIDFVDECLDTIKHMNFVSASEVQDMLLDIRLVCSSTIERTNEGENELQDEPGAPVGTDTGVSELADSPALN
jgi:hypothetical protein